MHRMKRYVRDGWFFYNSTCTLTDVKGDEGRGGNYPVLPNVVLCRPAFHDTIIIEKILGGKHRESIFCQPMSVNVSRCQSMSGCVSLFIL